jgi:nitrite reductase/ring-hydroxylating ferredoxin subunit
MAECFYRAISRTELREGESRAVTVNAWPILLVLWDGRVYAIANACTHANSALTKGRLRHGSIMCPLHGARFDLKSGECAGNVYAPLKTFATRATAEGIEVAVPSEPPDARFIPVCSRR